MKQIKETRAPKYYIEYYEQYDGTFVPGEEKYTTFEARLGTHEWGDTRWLTAYSYDDGETIESLGEVPGEQVRVYYILNRTTILYYSLVKYPLYFYNYNKLEKTEEVKCTTPLESYAAFVPSRPEGIPESFLFMGWYTDSTFSKKVTSELTMPTSDYTLYAKWAEPTFTVKVHKDLNPDGEYDTIEVPYMKMMDQGKLVEIMVSNLWATRGDDEKFSLFSLNTLIEKDYEIYPLVPELMTPYKVTYDMDGGTGNVVDQKSYLQYTSAQVLSGEGSTKDGKPFLKWELDGISYYPGSRVSIMGDVTLKAVYGDNPKPTSITYKPNGGEGEDYVQKGIANYDTVAVATLLETGIRREGYVFKGWSVSADGKGKLYHPGEGILLDKEDRNVLYAIWEKVEDPTPTPWPQAQTCQDVGYPSNYTWNENLKACVPYGVNKFPIVNTGVK